MISEFIKIIPKELPIGNEAKPWDIVRDLCTFIEQIQKNLGKDYDVHDGIAIHKTAKIGHDVTIKAPAIIGPDCFVGTHSYLRNGVYLAMGASIGLSCEIKHSIILSDSAVAHFNFVGDSIIGNNVNIEAGAILANHYNERPDERIYVYHRGKRQLIPLTKFGALVGDDCRIGANAVLSPGTLLQPKTVVGRLQLIEQNPIENN